ncbi:hypothetical protein SeMB42_g05567 [Synchytrium endobioticum]|uniref:AMP-dependent synthetase/ligase domain-containing protein n=1 Tax=Synchytrium endobioticum TaxID=286115 RepID=A0A507CR09_9FUNG|nr:hypothetical protein SeMB42_g05567 [Synchytrium endobioticum]
MKAAEAISWLVIRILYMAHLYGCTTVLYEGKPFGTPDAGAFFRLVHEYQVTVISTAPTAIRAIKREDPDGKRLANYDLSLLQSLFLAGERSDPDNINHFHELLEVPIRGYLEHDERPAYLKPPSKDNHAPMKRKVVLPGVGRARVERLARRCENPRSYGSRLQRSRNANFKRQENSNSCKL